LIFIILDILPKKDLPELSNEVLIGLKVSFYKGKMDVLSL